MDSNSSGLNITGVKVQQGIRSPEEYATLVQIAQALAPLLEAGLTSGKIVEKLMGAAEDPERIGAEFLPESLALDEDSLISMTASPGTLITSVNGGDINTSGGGGDLNTQAGGSFATGTGNLTGPNTSGTIALTADLAEKASSAIQTPQETLPSAILFHDDCTGVAATLADSATRTVEPGPGTMTARSMASSSLIRYENGEIVLSVINATGNAIAIVRDAARSVTAGLTCIVRLVPSFAPGDGAKNVFVGFSTSATSGAINGGMLNLGQVAGGICPYIVSPVSTYAGELYREGQEVAVAVKNVTTSHQQYWMQGGVLDTFGATLDSDNWILIAESFIDLSAATVYAMVASYNVGTTTRVRDFKVLSSWSPSNRHVTKDFNLTYLGTHIPTLARDPVSNLVIAAWHKGTTHTSADIEMRYSTKLTDGSWTAAATLLAAVGDGSAQQLNNISVINGALWLIYYRNAAAAVDGGTLYRRTISVNSTTGAITLGAEVLLGITGTRNLAFSPAITLPSGRIMLLHHFGDTLATQASYSDDNGITWTTNAIGQTGFEATGVIESDGAIGVMLRSSGYVAYYTRCANPQTAPQTWSARVAINSIPQPGATGSRMQYLKLASGEILLIGHDHKTTRRAITIWRMGDNGVVYDKTRVGEWNTTDAGTAVLQYPAFIEDGEDIITAISRQPSAVYTSGIAIQIDARRWAQPVSIHAGGNGQRDSKKFVAARPRHNANILVYGTAPVPDMSYGDNFYITLTASTAVIGAPLNGTPWQPIRISFIQGGSGSYTATFNAIFEFGNITPTWLTAVGATNTLEAYLNPLTGKYVVTRFI